MNRASSRKSLNSSGVFSPRAKGSGNCCCAHDAHCHLKQEHSGNSQQSRRQKQNISDNSSVYSRAQNPEDSARGGKEFVHKSPGKFTDDELKKMIAIIYDNYQYFTKKVEIPDSTESPKRKLNLPTKTGNSTYKGDFRKKELELQKPYKPNQITYKPNFQFDPNSTYKQCFAKVQNAATTIPEKVLPKDNLGNENGPRFLETQYEGEFKKWKPESVQKYTPLNSAIFKSGNFDGRTMYRSNYQGTPIKLQKEKSAHNLSSNIFQGPKIPVTSHYQAQFTNKPFQKQQKKGLKKYGSTPFLGGVGEYKTQYRSSFVKQKPPGTPSKKRYSKDQIVQMIVGS